MRDTELRALLTALRDIADNLGYIVDNTESIDNTLKKLLQERTKTDDKEK